MNRLLAEKIDKIITVFSAVFLIVISVSGIYLLYFGWFSLKEGAYSSCLASIANDINKNRHEIILNKSNEWKILSEKETDEILSKIEGGDCPHTPDLAVDPQNNRIQIAARKIDDEVEIIVWSKGCDEVSRTEDDIVIPSGKTPPPQ